MMQSRASWKTQSAANEGRQRPTEARGAPERTTRPAGNPMLDSLNLTTRQRAIIDDATDDVSIDRVERFQKYVADVLRGFREIRDSSVRHACCAALLRYGSRR
jgi:hypothetical protein